MQESSLNVNTKLLLNKLMNGQLNVRCNSYQNALNRESAPVKVLDRVQIKSIRLTKNKEAGPRTDLG